MSSYYTVMQSQFTKGPVTTEIVKELSGERFGVRGWFNDSYLGVDWFNNEREARTEAKRLTGLVK